MADAVLADLDADRARGVQGIGEAPRGVDLLKDFSATVTWLSFADPAEACRNSTASPTERYTVNSSPP